MGSHSKLFLCFRAQPSSLNIDLDGVNTVDCSGADRMLMMTSYLAAAEKKRKDIQKNKNKIKKKDKLLIGDTGRKDDGVTNRPRRKLSRVIKAVLFETVLKSGRFHKSKTPRKHQTRTLIEHSDDKTRDSTEPEIKSTTTKIPQFTPEATTDAKSSKTTVSAEQASDLPLKNSNQKEIVIDSENKKGTGGDQNGYRMMQMVYLVLFSLWMTVFLGRFLAVMTTTAGIYVCESQRMAALLFAIVGKKKTARVKKGETVPGIEEIQSHNHNHARKTTIA